MKIQRRLVEAKSNFTNDDYYNVKRLSKEELNNIIKSKKQLNDADTKSKATIDKLLSNGYLDATKLKSVTGKDLAGMVAEGLFNNAINNTFAFRAFISFFKGSNGNVMYTVLDDFTDSIGANMINKNNKFISEFIRMLRYLKGKVIYNGKAEITKEKFEDLYNIYARDESKFNEEVIIDYLSRGSRKTVTKDNTSKDQFVKDIIDEYNNSVKDALLKIDPKVANNFLDFIINGDKYEISYK